MDCGISGAAAELVGVRLQFRNIFAKPLRGGFACGNMAAMEESQITTIGIPRALLYHRFGVLWETFFEELGRTVVLSPETDADIADEGARISVDECCLASKVYMGHVARLAGACDAVFVPSVVGRNRRESYCTKFQALPDVVANTFAGQGVQVLSCLIDDQKPRGSEKDAFVDLGVRLGASPKEARRAYKAARKAHEQAVRERVAAQARGLEDVRSGHGRPDADDRPPIIMLVAHPYVAHDPFIGGEVVRLLESNGAYVAFADAFDAERALAASYDFSPTMPWTVNRELTGAIALESEGADGVVLVSAFPCGPDSMTNDIVARRVQGKPTLTLTIDAQSGTAGLETRIESFVDILQYQRKGGYVHA